MNKTVKGYIESFNRTQQMIRKHERRIEKLQLDIKECQSNLEIFCSFRNRLIEQLEINGYELVGEKWVKK